MASTQKKSQTDLATRPNETAVAPAETLNASARAGLMARVAGRYGVDADKMNVTLKQTAFRQRGKDGQAAVEVTNEQMLMLMVVADQYKLNPFTREIYAFPGENGIVAIVSVDGWIRIINERPELKSISFEVAPPGTEDPWISCTIERHDRSRPISITEYLSECSRDTKPWKSHPRRMLRHKALIQCARVAFGFGGIFDPDEADRIVMEVEQPTRIQGKPKTQAPKALEQPLVDSALRISQDQETLLRDMIQAEGIQATLFCAEFEIGDVSELPASAFEDAKQFIAETSAAD